jgi:starch phosphorylase
VPLYYTKRSADGLPGDWIERIKECIRTVAPQFSTTRMVKEYTTELYHPCWLTANEDASNKDEVK